MSGIALPAVRTGLLEWMCRCTVLYGLLSAFAGGPVLAAGPVPVSPQATIQGIVDQVVSVLDANREILRTDPATLTPRIAGIIDPYLDFTLMSEEVLGVTWRRADARQRMRFATVFHQLLNKDYAAAYKDYSGQSVRLTGQRWEDSAHTRAVVSSELTSPGAQPVAVEYRMHRGADGWKVYDVVVDGISLLINYRDEFGEELQHESLDRLIARLQRKVAPVHSP